MEANLGPIGGIVFLHGFMEDGRVFETFADKFKNAHAVYCPDLPGHGLNPVFSDVASMEAYARDVNAQLHDSGRLILIGHSMGGYVALAFAELFPNRVAGIVLMNSTCFADSETRKLERDRSMALMRENYPLFARSFVPNIFADASNSFIADITKMALEQNALGMMQSTLAMRDRANRCRFISEGNITVLLMAGKRDKLIPATIMEEIEDIASKHTKIEWFENSGHIVFMEEPERCEAVLRNWMAEHGFIPT
jgi:pimeloyl-ACP methyl ester carboxylesterase